MPVGLAPELPEVDELLSVEEPDMPEEEPELPDEVSLGECGQPPVLPWVLPVSPVVPDEGLLLVPVVEEPEELELPTSDAPEEEPVG